MALAMFGLIKTAIMLFVFVFVVLFPSQQLVLSAPPSPVFNRLFLPPTISGPESIAFGVGGEFFTGVADGRILKYQPGVGFQDFAYTATTRSKSECDGTTDLNMGPKCGRPFGLGYYYRTNQLFICDAFLGFFVAGTNGRLATQIASGAEGQAFKFCNGLDVDQNNGVVYFTDSSLVYDLRQAQRAAQVGDSTGRLLKYDPISRQVTVLLRNLSGPAGTAVSKDSSYVLVSEFTGNRTRRLWLTGPRAFTTETLHFQPRPNNIKRTATGEFWEAAASPKQTPPTALVPVGLRINAFASVVQQVSFEAYYNTTAISEVQASADSLYICSRFVNFIGIFKFN